ncbi:hypothetical protein NONO_c59850 [Nocardia nova SH22a]|uniref:Uncharacterized protein n=1 Tax=Nocardia nova SH22a TaxID=1415166 RepID=W5TU78_9NOCA|nr:hypothetical protein NONO_c59850 [Nocardia nova SH22a]
MSRPRHLSADAIREMVNRYKDPSVRQSDLARDFHVSREMVSQIMSGRRYSDISGITPAHSKECKNCRSRDIRQENVDLVRHGRGALPHLSQQNQAPHRNCDESARGGSL